jgi:glycerol-3-phosphate acyltransferase PlsY
VVARWAIPGVPLTPTRVVLDSGGTSVIVQRVSPSMLGARAGGRAGLAAAAIDVVKALVPTLVATAWLGDEAAAVVAAAVVVGHVVPVGHLREGGFGMSPVLGAVAALEPLGLVVVILAAIVVATVIGSPFFGTEVWVAFLPIWGWVVGDGWFVGFSLVAASLYLWTSRSEMAGAFRAWRADDRPWFSRWSDYWEYPVYEPVE